MYLDACRTHTHTQSVYCDSLTCFLPNPLDLLVSRTWSVTSWPLTPCCVSPGLAHVSDGTGSVNAEGKPCVFRGMILLHASLVCVIPPSVVQWWSSVMDLYLHGLSPHGVLYLFSYSWKICQIMCQVLMLPTPCTVKLGWFSSWKTSLDVRGGVWGSNR